jgi:hypothetical protein
MPAKKTSGSSKTVFQLKVTLDGVGPPIWRRLLVPSDITLGRLHDVIQAAMGWTNSHLHRFQIGEVSYSNPRHVENDSAFKDERKVRLASLVGPGESLLYEYDFGDGWEHRILVEKAVDRDPRLAYPLCLAGARACPPEDVGGALGYEHFLEVIANKKHENHDELLSWVGGIFDPEGFDVNWTNRELWAVR